jgi:DNA-binding NarL/FixJ family response regulator
VEGRNGDAAESLHARPLNILAAGAEAAVARLAGNVNGHHISLASAGGAKRPDVVVFACPRGGATRTLLDELRRSVDAAGSAADVPIIVVLAEAEGRWARKLIDDGAAGIVVENELTETLEPTLRAVASGLIAYPRRLRAAAERPNLSYREKQVLGMVVLGFTNREIGAKLWLAESTVKSHLSSAFGKLGVRSRSEAAAVILDPNEGLGTGILAISGSGEAPAEPE